MEAPWEEGPALVRSALGVSGVDGGPLVLAVFFFHCFGAGKSGALLI